MLKEAKWAVAVSLLATLLLLFVAYTTEHDNLTKEEWQTVKVCGGREVRIPAGWPADDYKKATELDCGIFPPRHPHSPTPVRI